MRCIACFRSPRCLIWATLDAGILGFLQLFAGLTKLKTLAGYVSAMALETQETIGRKSATGC